MSATAGTTFFLDNFALKCFDPQSTTGTYINCGEAEFVRVVHEHYEQVNPVYLVLKLTTTWAACAVC